MFPVTSSITSSNLQLDSMMEIDLDAINTLRGIIDIPSQKESRLVLTMPILRRGNSNSSDEMDVLLFCKGDLLERNFELKAIGKEVIVKGEFLVIKKIGMLYMEVESIEFVEEESSPLRPRSPPSKRSVRTKTSKDLIGYIKIKSEIQNLNVVGSSAFVRFIHTSRAGLVKNKATMVVLQQSSLSLYPFLHRGDGRKNLYIISNTKRANLTSSALSSGQQYAMLIQATPSG